jgi:hypothetical protein
MKQCTKCLEVKELSEFNKMRASKDVLQYKCKACIVYYNKKNADKIKEHKKQYYQDNVEKYKQYREEHSEEIKKYRKLYKIENADIVKEYDKQYRNSLKDGKHHVYYLPDHNYVGTTECIKLRMYDHKNVHGRNTENYEILASFENRDKALRFESLLHDSGFEGRHIKNRYI